MLEERLKFIPDIIIPLSASFNDVSNQVDHAIMNFTICKEYLLQLNNRELDISMAKHSYEPRQILKNEFIGPVGSYDLHFISGAPPERKDYLTFIMPFDSYTWAFTLTSVVGVSIVWIIIDKIHTTLSHESSKESIFKSMKLSGYNFISLASSIFCRHLIRHWGPHPRGPGGSPQEKIHFKKLCLKS